MPTIDQVTVVTTCAVCAAEIETNTVKKDNMMLSSKALVWCPACSAERPQRRDIVDRLETIAEEQASYPQSELAVPFGAPPER